MVEASISFQGPNSAKIQSILFYSYLFNSTSNVRTMMMNAFCIGIQYTENENQQIATKGDNFLLASPFCKNTFGKCQNLVDRP